MSRERIAGGRIETDMSRWPIVVHRTIGSPTDHEVDGFIHRANGILARRARHAVIFDSLLSEMPSKYMRERSIDWLRQNGEGLRDHCVGTALMFRSPALRFVLSGVMLMSSHPTPHIVCGTLEEAIRWSRSQLDLGLDVGRAGR
jgi:hypothetical protein